MSDIKRTRSGFVEPTDLERLDRAEAKRRRRAGIQPSPVLLSPKKEDPMEHCENCKFWLRSLDEKAAPAPDGSGVCRRYPPQPIATNWVGQQPGLLPKPGQPAQTMYSIVNTGSLFPMMHEHGYCGEHQPSPETPRH